MAGEIIQNVSGQQYEKVPNGETGDSIVQNADGTKSMATPRSAGNASYRSSTNTSTPPSSGQIRWNDGDQALATKLFIDNSDSDGIDYTTFLGNVKIGDAIYIQDQGDPNKYQYWNITNITSPSGYKEYDVTLLDAVGGNFGNNNKLLTSYRPQGGTLQNLATTVEAAQAPSPPLGTPEPTDEFLFVDNSNELVKIGLIRDIAAANVTDAFVSGTGTNIIATSTPKALEIFDSNFYSSAPGVIGYDSVTFTGLKVFVPLRFIVTCTVSIRSPGSTDFFFQIYAGNTPIGEQVDVSGDGTSRARNFTVRAFTQVMTPNDIIELRVSNNNDNITNITATMDIQFAGTT